MVNLSITNPHVYYVYPLFEEGGKVRQLQVMLAFGEVKPGKGGLRRGVNAIARDLNEVAGVFARYMRARAALVEVGDYEVPTRSFYECSFFVAGGDKHSGFWSAPVELTVYGVELIHEGEPDADTARLVAADFEQLMSDFIGVPRGHDMTHVSQENLDDGKTYKFSWDNWGSGPD